VSFLEDRQIFFERGKNINSEGGGQKKAREEGYPTEKGSLKKKFVPFKGLGSVRHYLSAKNEESSNF